MDWIDKTEYPFKSHYYLVNGQKMHYIDEGQGDTILFVHGTPSWSFDFRHLIKELRNSYRCIAIDHIGFGLSNKPAEYNYSTQNHSKTLEQFVVDKNLQDITLVVHDFGGPIGLSMAIRQAARIKQLVVLNSWLWSSEGEPEFEKMKPILKSPLLPFLYRWLNFSPKFLIPKTFGDKKIGKTTLKHYTHVFRNRHERNGALAFARSLLNDQSWFEQQWQKREAINNKPLLLIWGMKDPVIGPKNLDKFANGFNNVKILKLNTSGHFPQEEQPQQVITSIEQFLQ